ncbi:nicotinate phosphoribosyltransferase [Coemansia sp. Benny D115]|nr:nicotinate phosphoribosyltransferase [Coemansia sp. Benny D115]
MLHDIEEHSPASILDQDLYKFCMQQAVLQHYPEAEVQYTFINRDSTFRFTAGSFAWLESRIADLSGITATAADIDYLRKACPYLTTEYLDYLAAFQFKPFAHIQCSLNAATGELSLQVKGNWSQVILYEIPLLSLISESYFKFVDTDWNYDGQLEKIINKGTRLIDAGCKFAEFGTRRRRDFKTQDIIMAGLTQIQATGLGRLTGSSNVYLARKYNVVPVGTVGHEWIMAVAALEKTYVNANKLAMEKWHATFKGKLGIALSDTFGSKAFFANFLYGLASEYTGVRHDSGDPFSFAQSVCEHYKKMGIDPGSKVVVFSDGLNPEFAIDLQSHAKQLGIGCSFGIGTNFTNDFTCASDTAKRSNAANIVIKITKCNSRDCIKLSDVTTKHSGDSAELERAQLELSAAGLLD